MMSMLKNKTKSSQELVRGCLTAGGSAHYFTLSTHKTQHGSFKQHSTPNPSFAIVIC